MGNERLRVVFMGCPEFSVPALDAIADDPAFEIVAVYSMPDKPRGRGHQTTPTPVKERALARGIPVATPPSFRKDPAAVEALRALKPDFLAVVAYGLILPPDVLAIPRLAPVNLHASLLPKYRGPSPIHAALLAGDAETGNTVMLMSAKMDEGDMLAVERLPIGDDESLASLHDRLSVSGGPLLARTLKEFAAGCVRPQAQDHSLATYTTKISPEIARLDWNRSARELSCLVRAMTPCPGAWFEHDGNRIKVGKVAIGPSCNRTDASPTGTFLHADPARGVRIACGGDTTLDLLMLQRPGKGMMPVSDFLRGYPLKKRDAGQ